MCVVPSGFEIFLTFCGCVGQLPDGLGVFIRDHILCVWYGPIFGVCMHEHELRSVPLMIELTDCSDVRTHLRARIQIRLIRGETRFISISYGRNRYWYVRDDQMWVNTLRRFEISCLG